MLVLSSLVLLPVLVSGASPGFIIQFQNVTNHSQLTTEAYAEYTGDLTPSLADMQAMFDDVRKLLPQQR